jgi:hypothetical protein
MHDALGDAAGDTVLSLREAAVTAVVTAFTNLLGLRHFGFPLDELIYWPLYLIVMVVVAVLAALLVAALIKLFEVSSGVGKAVLNAIVTAVVSFVVLALANLLLSTSSATAADEESPVPVPPTGIPAPPTPKAPQPGNTDLCELGTPELFTSLAADLGREGKGAAGNAHWTSCPFAREVKTAYIQKYGLGNSGELCVVSPVVPQNGPIHMNCAPESAVMIVCEGGDEAKIFIF